MAITYTHWRQDPYWQRELKKIQKISLQDNDQEENIEVVPVSKPKAQTRPVVKATQARPVKLTNKEKVMQLLSDGKWHTTAEIIDPNVGGKEGARRVRELRAIQGGYRIEKRKIMKSKQFEYRIIHTGGRTDGKSSKNVSQKAQCSSTNR